MLCSRLTNGELFLKTKSYRWKETLPIIPIFKIWAHSMLPWQRLKHVSFKKVKTRLKIGREIWTSAWSNHYIFLLTTMFWVQTSSLKSWFILDWILWAFLQIPHTFLNFVLFSIMGRRSSTFVVKRFTWARPCLSHADEKRWFKRSILVDDPSCFANYYCADHNESIL
jgi:hypothetical protein